MEKATVFAQRAFIPATQPSSRQQLVTLDSPTIITYESPDKKDPKLLLTPGREKLWKEWADVYQAKRLPEGEYLGRLYDIGFDRPETHVVRKGDRLYYAFYAKRFQGPVPLRGLGARPYRVRDYVAGRDLGRVSGPGASLAVDFERYLLVEATPE